MTVLSDSPTAHAVGYDLPPSGLKPEDSVRSRRKRLTSLGSDGQKTSTSPKHRMSHRFYLARPRLTLTRSVSEERNTSPRLHFGLVCRSGKCLTLGRARFNRVGNAPYVEW